MLKNFLVSTFRNLFRQKGYTLLNLFGLAFGLACFILLFLYIQYETSYDKHHVNHERIYKVYQKNNRNDDSGFMGYTEFAVTPAPLSRALMEEFPEVEAATVIDDARQMLVEANNQSFLEDEWYWSDSHIFDVFTIPLVQGDPEKALEKKYSVVVSEDIAEKYFGNENPIGRELILRNEQSFTITCVIENMPGNAHFSCDFIAAIESIDHFEKELTQWNSSSYHTYFMLKEGHDHTSLVSKYPAFRQAKNKDNPNWSIKDADEWRHIRLTDIHLKSKTTFNLGSVSDIRYIYMFSAIGLFILLIACINYMNLSTARSLIRAREVGIRKVVGALRVQLIWQFLGESLIIVYSSLATAVLIAYLLLPKFNMLIDRQLELNVVQNWQFFGFIAAAGLVVGLLSGSYPAILISRYQPVTMLKGSYSGYRRGIVMRNGLVVFQFVISVALIISTIIISNQIEYFRTKKLGFSRDHVVVIRMADKAVRDNTVVFKEELQRLPGVLAVSNCGSLPMMISSKTSRKYEGMPDPEKKIQIYVANIDHDYIDLFDMNIVKGRNFSREFHTDTASVLINEKTAEVLGWEEPVGKWIQSRRNDHQYNVIGVVEDFQHASMKLEVSPVYFILREVAGWRMAIRISSDDIPATIAAIGKVWDRFSNGYPYKYEFMDEQYDRMYKSEIRLGETFTWFALLAILICCIGLFGLASFTAEQSTKEIGIRKTLGASVSRITGLLCWKFTKWVILSNIIAWPIAYYAMNVWLQNYAHRIEPGPITFLQAFAAAVVISLVTISVQTFRAATANPVEALRNE